MEKTWDGQPISPEAPYGASIVVYRRTVQGYETLLLHRAWRGPHYEGDWAWTPPSGARLPGEPIERCAARELLEEAGITAPLRMVSEPTADWVVYVAEVGPDTAVRLVDAEHDRYEWVPFETALKRCRPEPVAHGIASAAAFIEQRTEDAS